MAATGKELYERQCLSCHSLNGASTHAGPSLNGVIWRRIAILPDFDYSPGLKAVRGRWSPGRLDAYLSNSQAFARGTDMFWDVHDAATRKAIIAYLQTMK